MIKAVSNQTMRESDAWTIAHGTPSRELMFRAGKGIFDSGSWKTPVAVVCGKGNNAGDGFVVADLMKKAGIDCTIILLSDRFSEDGNYYYECAVRDEVPVRTFQSASDLKGYRSVVDCIFGTGFHGEVKGIYREVIEAINASGAYVVSADMNSGLNGDTGLGDCYVKSDLTVSIGSYKIGHFCGNAETAMKEKVNIDIGITIVGPVVTFD